MIAKTQLLETYTFEEPDSVNRLQIPRRPSTVSGLASHNSISARLSPNASEPAWDPKSHHQPRPDLALEIVADDLTGLRQFE